MAFRFLCATDKDFEAVAQLTRALDLVPSVPVTRARRREEINLQVALINPLQHIKGYGAPETRAAAERARLLIEQAEALGEPPEDPLLLFSVLYGFLVAAMVAFDGDAFRELAVQFMALAKKQGATTPLLLGHRFMGAALLHTGDIFESRPHFDRAIVLYDPAEHRLLATRFGIDARVQVLCFRSMALWMLGYPSAALADTQQALKEAREIGQVTTLMIALSFTSLTHMHCGNYAAVDGQSDELGALANQKGATPYKTLSVLQHGNLLALSGKAADAVDTITSGITAWRSAGATMWMPLYLSCLARAYADLGQFDNAWRCSMNFVTTPRGLHGKGEP
jgi:tetratricopeptide (TPR) repeat protein